MNIAELKNIDNNLTLLENSKIFESKETKHSEIIAYFLYNTKEFLAKVLDKAGVSVNNLENLIIKTESDKRKDILVKNNEFVLVIENKYKDQNREYEARSTQLEKYEKYIKEHYPDKQQILIYLRPFMHELTENCKNWKQFTYKDIWEILNTIEPNSELERYKQIIAKIYEPQKICISAIKEILNLDNTNIQPDDARGDINGCSIEIPLLNTDYRSFLQIEYSSPTEKNGCLSINLTAKITDMTDKDKILLETVKNAGVNCDRNNDYEWITEIICDNTHLTRETVEEKLKNSKIIKAVKQIINS